MRSIRNQVAALITAVALLLGVGSSSAQAFDFTVNVTKDFSFGILVVEGSILFGIARMKFGGKSCERLESVTGGSWQGIPNPLLLSRIAVTCMEPSPEAPPAPEVKPDG